ncbi:hypothetical protein [Pinirhizobacter soli]|uniref:hypothetical protein n=1 Tax=Pinirhizobacter soli TaxID=2786953 RepID=UPI00202A081F|nr:hypothetical protein [Pinirhizobacter soli]
MSYVAAFFLGAFLCNAIPHLAHGLSGEPFQTPFAKPHGVGLSSPVVNVLWGLANVAAAVAIADFSTVVSGGWTLHATALLGALVIGLFTAVHFGKVRHPEG